MKAALRLAAKAAFDYLRTSPKAHAAMVTVAYGIIEAIRASLGHA
jgi:hypothetical protein